MGLPPSPNLMYEWALLLVHIAVADDDDDTVVVVDVTKDDKFLGSRKKKEEAKMERLRKAWTR